MRLKTIARGIDINFFNPKLISQSEIHKALDELNLKKESIKILLPGRLTRWKGHSILIKAIANLLKSHQFDIQVLIFGPEDNQKLKNETVKEIHSYNLENIVKFYGPSKQMNLIYGLSDIVISSSTDPEAFGRISIEAQAMGKYIIASNHGGSQETVIEGKTGSLYSPLSHKELSATILDVIKNLKYKSDSVFDSAIDNVAKEIQQNIDQGEPRRVYDTPSKGVLWGWEVSAYVFTKAIATGTFMMMGFWNFINGPLDSSAELYGLVTTLIFMSITGALLVKDLDRPDRFLYVLLRPQWKSWLVKGAYIITVFGGLVMLKLIDNYYGLSWNWLWGVGSIFAILGAVYTAFLFAQARARDLWQSKWLSAIHMLVHAIISGSFVMILIEPVSRSMMSNLLFFAIIINLLIIFKEIRFPDNTPDSKKAIMLMTKGYYSKYFWSGLVIGTIIPIIMLSTQIENLLIISGVLSLIGNYLTEYVRIRIPQMIPLS
ncbi:MAG: hypothetical protein CMG14_03250 [Candidatus Marinimicrobia bacterium]|nr:hypothetical protein [Candidatus Neomarinimicrobiota bacterium]